MLKVIGLFLMFISWYNLENSLFGLETIQVLLIGVFFFFGEDLFKHLFFVEREKVRAKYRRRT